MITIEEFLGLSTKEVLKHIRSLGYTQISEIFKNPDFESKYDFSKRADIYPPLEKMLAVLGIEDKNGAITDMENWYSETRSGGGKIYITVDPSKLTSLNNPAGISIPELELEYQLYDTSKRITQVHIYSDYRKSGVFDKSAYWIGEDLIFDRRPEYTKFGLGLVFDHEKQSVIDHIKDLYEAARTKGATAQSFCDRAFSGELKKGIEDLTGEYVPFMEYGMHHMMFSGFLELCVEEGLDFSDLVALCAGQGIGVCTDTMQKTIGIIRGRPNTDSTKEIADKIKQFFKNRGVVTKEKRVSNAYTDLISAVLKMREVIASQHGINSSDLSDIIINGTKI